MEFKELDIVLWKGEPHTFLRYKPSMNPLSSARAYIKEPWGRFILVPVAELTPYSRKYTRTNKGALHLLKKF